MSDSDLRLRLNKTLELGIPRDLAIVAGGIVLGLAAIAILATWCFLGDTRASSRDA